MDLMRIIAGIVGRGNVPAGGVPTIPNGLAVGDIYPDAIAASRAWTAAGGKQSGLKVAPVGDGTYTHIPDPAATAPQTTGAGTQPSPTGWNPALAPLPPKPRPQPVPSSYSMDRRGLPGRDPIGPRTQRTYRDESGNEVPLTDPEGRPLYEEAFLAGKHAPDGPDVPLPMMPDTRALANRLGTVTDDRGMIMRDDARGAVKVRQPGTVTDPPLLSMRVDPNQPDDDYMASFRHEVGHMIDYHTERTERGKNAGIQQWAIPDDIRGELEAASLKMRPDLWNKPESWWKEYRERPDELMADAKRFYQEDPAGFKAIAPNGAEYIRAMVNDDPNLSGIVQFNVKGGPPKPAEVPTDDKRPDSDPIGNYQLPVGNIPLPGGYVLNDLLAPFTDKRGDDRLLPETLSLNDIGRSLAGLSPGAQVKSHMEAQAGRTVEGEEIGSFARLLGLFPAADALTGGVAAPATRAGSTTLGTYAGRRARTADIPALQKAQRMARKGGNAEPGGEIQQQTGWFRNPGEEWQFEISDRDASLKPHPTDPNQMVLDHPDLTAAYPEIGNMPIHLIAPDMPMHGWYGRGGMYPDTGEIGIRRDLDPDQRRSVALHEIGGHAVQDIEGFSGGSSPQANVNLSQQLTQSIFDTAKDKWQSGEMTADQALDWVAEQTRGLSSFDLYQRQLGEYAARDIEARRDMTDAQRRETPPYSSEAIPHADLLTTLNPPFRPGGRPRRATNEPPPQTDPERRVPMTPALAAFLRMGGT